MPALESSLLATVKRRLKAIPRTSVKKFHSSAMQRDIDLLIITHGMALLFELKRTGNEAGADVYQRAKLRKWAKSARFCGVSDDADEIVRVVKEIAEEAHIKEELYAKHLSEKRS